MSARSIVRSLLPVLLLGVLTSCQTTQAPEEPSQASGADTVTDQAVSEWNGITVAWALNNRCKFITGTARDEFFSNRVRVDEAVELFISAEEQMLKHVMAARFVMKPPYSQCGEDEEVLVKHIAALTQSMADELKQLGEVE